MTPKTLPDVMVLEYQPELKCSIWKNYHYRSKTMKGLRNSLRREVKSGRFVGWRLITVHEEEIGVKL